MTVKLTWYGHSTIGLDMDGVQVLIDPFFSDNPLASVNADSVAADYIIVTHGHGDHIGDSVAIAKRTGATIISNFEICNWLTAQGVENVHPQHIGGGFTYPFGYVKLTIAHHGSALPDGSYGGNPTGVLITTNDKKKIYIAGDTGLFYSMKLIGDEGLDLAVLPIGDNFTMGPDDALRAVKLLSPGAVIPIHFNTWELIVQDPKAWANRVDNETTTRPVVLEPGNTFSL
ncbi:MAG: metal-dependent hydrolase [Anaerolineales bacterium]|nr:metal-dependent hydrolase [Anaerolineales bacterium]